MSGKKMQKDFDVIIIGGGAAGMSAALWCDELKLKALLFEENSKLGGQLHIVHNPIENHLGITAKNGYELNEIFLRQLAGRRFEKVLNAGIENVNLENKTVFLGDGKSFSARAIVIATGVSRRRLHIPGEEEFTGKGILVSGNRDAEKMKDKIVCIIGGGDAALENAGILAKTAKKVYLIHRREKFSARPEFIRQAQNFKNVEILMQTSVTAINGTNKIEAIEIKSAENHRKTLIIDGILIRIGVFPNIQLFENQLKTDEKGYIRTDSNCRSSIPDIFAVGDVSNPTSPTVSTAVGNGATVVKIIYNKLNNLH